MSETWIWSVEAPAGGFRTGVPLFVRAHPTGDNVPASTPTAFLRATEGPGSSLTTELPLEPVPGHRDWIREFSVSLPGTYAVTFENETRTFLAQDSSFISFGREFGIFSAATVILVGAMLVWLIRRKGEA